MICACSMVLIPAPEPSSVPVVTKSLFVRRTQALKWSKSHLMASLKHWLTMLQRDSTSYGGNDCQNICFFYGMTCPFYGLSMSFMPNQTSFRTFPYSIAHEVDFWNYAKHLEQRRGNIRWKNFEKLFEKHRKWRRTNSAQLQKLIESGSWSAEISIGWIMSFAKIWSYLHIYTV